MSVVVKEIVRRLENLPRPAHSLSANIFKQFEYFDITGLPGDPFLDPNLSRTVPYR
jgi:hypothetical protein